MELRHLRYFVAVAEELSFTRAAERLHIAQPPLSIQIRALEDEIEVKLFDRDRRRVFLTQAGLHFLDRARAILRDVDIAKGEARCAAAGAIARITLGYAASSMLSMVLPNALQRFRQDNPHVLLTLQEMTSAEQLTALSERLLDIGVLRQPDVTIPEDVAIEEWHQSTLVAAIPCTHRLSTGPIRLTDLKDEPLIMYPSDVGIGLYWKVQDLCAQAGFRPSKVHEARDASTIVGLVAAGAGIALIPDDVRCIQIRGAVYQPVLDKSAVSSLWLAYRTPRTGDAVSELLEILKSENK